MYVPDRLLHCNRARRLAGRPERRPDRLVNRFFGLGIAWSPDRLDPAVVVALVVALAELAFGELHGTVDRCYCDTVMMISRTVRLLLLLLLPVIVLPAFVLKEFGL